MPRFDSGDIAEQCIVWKKMTLEAEIEKTLMVVEDGYTPTKARETKEAYARAGFDPKDIIVGAGGYFQEGVGKNGQAVVLIFEQAVVLNFEQTVVDARLACLADGRFPGERPGHQGRDEPRMVFQNPNVAESTGRNHRHRFIFFQHDASVG